MEVAELIGCLVMSNVRAVWIPSCSAIVLSCYAPTLTSGEEQKYCFYGQLHITLSEISNGDKRVLLGDFNGMGGSHRKKWRW